MSCNWRLHASLLPDGTTWAIKSIENLEHTCQGVELRNSMVNCKWAKRVLLDDIRANNDIPAKSLNDLLFQRYGVNMAQSTLYRVKTQALEEIHGRHDVSYKHLPMYCDVIKELNTGSLAHCAWKDANHPERPLAFSSIFIAFKASLDGLKSGCRSLIGVDGAHLKGHFGGVLLSAVALDGNNEIFPIAWEIVGGEDAETWKLFIWNLKNALKDSGRGDEWCIISDRQKGIEAAILECWPKVGRRYCCKHLLKNFKPQFPGLLMFSLFWLACGAFNPFIFRKAMERLQKANPLVVVWFSKLGPQSVWSKHEFNPAIKSDVNKSNFVESFNSTLGLDRCRPVMTLLEGNISHLPRMATRREACEKWRGDICPNIVRRLQVISEESRSCKCLVSGEGEYEVLDGRSVLPVNLRAGTCACNAWQLTGLPCKHAMRAILHSHDDPHKYWPQSQYPEIAPPQMKRGIGRPARNRRREEGEQAKGKRSKTVRCSKCQTFGHNAQTCQGGMTGKVKAGLQATTAESKKKKALATSSQPLRKSPRGKTQGVSLSQPDPAPASSSQPVRRSPRAKKAMTGLFASQPVP
ncbi:uncharacterized protein LOC110725417 [Chenopodium quinoa]|uniref:uncharacterized protein LOC110725417 n=1 Tax=Chenopodium quinoa TaxID=63459 RepID=UPI000B774EC2|nr:uncharacterized protein LOC110725417 [Chenopodium quinoa]